MVSQNDNDVSNNSTMASGGSKDDLPDRDAARGFYQKYEPKEILGRGLTSVVRRCVNKQTGQEYAVKILDVSDGSGGQDNSSVAADDIPPMNPVAPQVDNGNDDAALTLLQECHREIEVIQRLSGHPYIVNLHDVYESPTFVFLVFELCRNGELFDYLTSKITLSEKRVRSIMKQIFEAVAHCHENAIVHRDLKPENILLDDDFNVKLTDFGFAKRLKSGERLYEVCGTPGYLAPELLQAGMLERSEHPGYSFEVDAWACGVIMYTLLVGSPPFWHRRQIVMIRLILDGRFTFTSPEWDGITDETKDLITKLLTVDPSQRMTVKQALHHEVFQAVRGSLRREMSIRRQKSLELAETAKESQVEVIKEPEPELPPFNARRTLRIGLICVQFVIRFKNLRNTPEPLSLAQCRVNPYAMRTCRKVIDNAAFGIYSHWVKKGEGQNRAALFEHFVKKTAKRESTEQEKEEVEVDQGKKEQSMPVKFY